MPVCDEMIRQDILRMAQEDLTLQPFASQAEWQTWLAKNRWARDAEHIKSFAGHARTSGINSAMFGLVPASALQFRTRADGTESIVLGKLTERHRAVLDLVTVSRVAAVRRTARIYATEAASEFALTLRGRYQRFVGSEYLPDPARAAEKFPIPHQDVMALTWPDGVFDIVITQDVLEHVPDPAKALAEMARVLRPGGLMISTFPFRWGAEEPLIRARLKDGEIEHLMEPERHRDPQSREGALVFQTPGWNIVGLARASFSRAEMAFYSSKIGGIVGQHAAGQWLLLGEK